MARWLKAGVRADAADAMTRRREFLKRKVLDDLATERREREAFEAWRQGLVRPFRITWALDSRDLYGPEVDLALGVQEPAVDEWEAGVRYPTWEQLQALAKLTDYPLTFFTRSPGPVVLGWRHTSMRFHVPKAVYAEMVVAGDPVIAFLPEAVKAVVG